MHVPVQLKAILFDMDGVLVDVSRSYRRAIEETAAHFTGRILVPGTIQRYKNMGGFNNDWRLTHAIISNTGIQVSYTRVVEEFQRRYRGANWDGFITEEPQLFTSPILDALQDENRILGIVTGRPHAEVQWTINRFGWKKTFPLVVAQESQEGRGKPDPYPLQRAVAILNEAGYNIVPEEVAYVGDTVDDMVATRAAGMWAIGFVPPYVDGPAHEALLYERGAHLVLHQAAALPDALATLGKTNTPEAIIEDVQL